MAAAMTCSSFHLAALLLGTWVVCVAGSDGAIEVEGIHSLDDAETNHTNKQQPLPTAGYQTEDKVMPPKNDMGVPDFSLIENNRVCLRATFESKIVIKYRTAPTAKLPTRILEVETQVPGDAVVSGVCGHDDGSKDAELQLSWDVYTLTFSFALETLEDKSFSPPVMTWFARNISMTINLTASQFHSPKEGGVHDVINTDDSHFNTPANFSFSCYSQQGIQLQEQNKTKSEATITAVSLSMWSTQIQAYELPSDGKFKKSARCMLDMSIPSQNTVPVIVAGCVAALILIVLIAYFAIRHTSKMQYRPME